MLQYDSMLYQYMERRKKKKEREGPGVDKE